MRDQTDEQLKQKVRSWWHDNPMDYYIEAEYGTETYFREVDRKNMKWGTPLEGNPHPQAQGLLDYDGVIAGKTVLEVGMGIGSLFESISRRAERAYGIDLTPFAAQMVGKRKQMFGLDNATPINADAENLPFADESFDTVVSWGVIMHTPNTPRAVSEMWRVLKPGGKVRVMIYHRNSLFYWYKIWFGWGVARGGLFSGKSAQEVTNSILDRGSPLAKVYSRDEAYTMFSQFKDVDIRSVGEAGFDGVPHARFPIVSKAVLRGPVRRAMVRRYGFFLWIEGTK